MEYQDSEKAKEVETRVRSFMEEVVLPREREALATNEKITEAEMHELWDEARERDLFAPQMPEEYGGQGLSFREMLPSFEQIGRSLIGARSIRANAPDEGNMHTLEKVGTEEQKEEWLQPLVQGEITSAFSMTEPMQGGGSDPKMLKSTAIKDGDEWVINAHKWWTTNGSNADFFLVMARTDMDAHPYNGSSIILVPADADGVNVVREIPHLGGEGIYDAPYGECEMKFDGVRVPVENTVGEEHGGFRVAQLRLGGGRLTHCMRFSGMAERALDIMKAYISERKAFGEPIAEKQAVRHRIADAETELHMARTGIRHAARALDHSDARVEVAMAKVFTANVTKDIIDLALQYCGGNGIGKDLPIAYFYELVRTFPIVDGADEVHRRTIAQNAFEELNDVETESVLRFDESLKREF
jgi:acyl-CoA dehydrogenase